MDHTLQLAVLDSFVKENCNEMEISTLISKVRAMSSYVRKSSNMRIKLQEVQRALGHRLLVPKMDCATRWASLYEMVNRFVEIYPDLQLMTLRGDFDECGMVFNFFVD